MPYSCISAIDQADCMLSFSVVSDYVRDGCKPWHLVVRLFSLTSFYRSWCTKLHGCICTLEQL